MQMRFNDNQINQILCCAVQVGGVGLVKSQSRPFVMKLASYPDRDPRPMVSIPRR